MSIVTISAPAAVAASKATQSIPIVAFVAADPIASGLAKSLAHPGGNVTVLRFSQRKPRRSASN